MNGLYAVLIVIVAVLSAIAKCREGLRGRNLVKAIVRDCLVPLSALAGGLIALIGTAIVFALRR